MICHRIRQQFIRGRRHICEHLIHIAAFVQAQGRIITKATLKHGRDFYWQNFRGTPGTTHLENYPRRTPAPVARNNFSEPMVKATGVAFGRSPTSTMQWQTFLMHTYEYLDEATSFSEAAPNGYEGELLHNRQLGRKV